MKIYVVNYKEVTIDANNIVEVNSGVCDYGYTNEEDAIKKVDELCDKKMNEFIDEIDMENEKIENGEMDLDEVRVFHESNRNRDWQSVFHYDDTYEYFVTMVVVKE